VVGGRSSDTRTVRPIAGIDPKNAAPLIARRKANSRALSLGEYWNVYFYVNKIKRKLWLKRAQVSAFRWEGVQGEFVQGLIAEGRADDPDLAIDEFAANLLYYCVVPWTHGEYVGETSVSFRKRVQQHLGRARRGKKNRLMRVHAELRKLGAHRSIWFVVSSWSNVRVTKYEREEAEAEIVWERQPAWNVDGRKSMAWSDKSCDEALLAVRRGRHRPLIKFRAQPARTPEYVTTLKQVEERTRKKRRDLVKFGARLGRRPLRKGPGFDELKGVVRIRNMTARDAIQLMHVIQKCLDGTSRSIAMTNVRKIWSGRRSVVQFGFLEIKTPLFAMRNARVPIRKALRRWAGAWSKRGVAMYVRIRLQSSASLGMIDVLNNTGPCARKKAWELV
jgi:hypothetical protein